MTADNIGQILASGCVYNDCANGDVILTDGENFVRVTASGEFVGLWNELTNEFEAVS